MKLKELTDPQAIAQAIAEFDRLERQAFLRKYGFGPARAHFIQWAGRLYDAKAVVGAAVGYQHPESGPLPFEELAGKERAITERLRQLGFEVVLANPSPWAQKTPADLRRGDELTNSDLVAVFRCGINGGMRRSHATNALVLVSDPTKGLYWDEWRDGLLHYTGMGLRGPQTFEGNQNLTLAQSRENGVHVHLCEVHKEGVYTYVGRVELASDPYQGQQPDADGNIRTVWIFPPKRMDAGEPLPVPHLSLLKVADRQRREALRLTDDQVVARAALRAQPASSRTTTSVTYLRDAYIAEHARRRAGGVCELCEQAAPFLDRNGEPYLESHHIVWLSRGGEDSIHNTVALCPNCHRKMHMLDLPADRRKLRERAARGLRAPASLSTHEHDAAGVSAQAD